MNKKVFLAKSLVAILVINLILSTTVFKINASAAVEISEGKVDSLIEGIDSNTLKEEYIKNIEELKGKKQVESNKDIIKSIDMDIESYSTLLKDIEDGIINDEILSESKRILNSNSNTEASKARGIVDNTVIKGSIMLVISVGDEMGYKTAAKLLRQSMTATTNSTYDIWNTDWIVSNRVKESADYKQFVSEVSKSYSKSGNKNYTYNGKPLEFKPGSTTVAQDLYYAIHGCNGGVDINIKNGYGDLVIKDIYDFPELTWFPKSKGDLLNNLGQLATSRGICKVYNVKIHVVQAFYGSVPSTGGTSSSTGSSSSSTYPGYLIQVGSSGANVTKIQQRLNALGYSAGTADGVFGTSTKNAVISFQKNKGLTADGIVGQSTWNALFNSSSSSSSTNKYPGYLIQVGSSGANVTKIQQRLNALGYSAGTADGIFGSATKNAVISFQKKKGLTADGIVGQSTWNALFN